MGADIAVMNSRGQVVIPLNVRKKLNLKEGDVLAVADSAGNLVMKKIKTPSREELLMEWNALVRKGNQRMKALGIKEEDVSDIIHRRRGVKP